jgi:Derlin-2/3
VTVWYYFNDIYPPLHEGHSPLDPPSWWVRLIEGRRAPVAEEPVEEATAAEAEVEAANQGLNDVPAEVAPVQ